MKHLPERITFDLEPYGFNRKSTLGMYQYKSIQEGLTPHQHPGNLEICFILSGRQIYHVRGNFYSLKAGDCFITYPGEVHSTGDYPQDKGSVVWLIIGKRTSKTPFDFKLLIQSILTKRPRFFKYSDKAPALIRDLVKVLQSKPTLLKAARIRQLLCTLLLETIDHSKKKDRPQVSPAISKALDHIQKSEEPLTIKHLAKQAGISIPHFNKRFKSEISFSPHDYILRKKINDSLRKLESPHSIITEVAFDLGFSSSQYFATVFKRYVGKSPRQYKAAHSVIREPLTPYRINAIR
jgi:AraC-like DNA-binding protein